MQHTLTQCYQRNESWKGNNILFLSANNFPRALIFKTTTKGGEEKNYPEKNEDDVDDEEKEKKVYIIL